MVLCCEVAARSEGCLVGLDHWMSCCIPLSDFQVLGFFMIGRIGYLSTHGCLFFFFLMYNFNEDSDGALYRLMYLDRCGIADPLAFFSSRRTFE